MALKQPQPCPGMPVDIGGTYCIWQGDVFGNNNYQQTGDNWAASGFGFAGVSKPEAGRTASGTYNVQAVFPANTQNTSETSGPTPASFILHWYNANGTEVSNNSNLAAEIVRINIFGVR